MSVVTHIYEEETADTPDGVGSCGCVCDVKAEQVLCMAMKKSKSS